MTASRPTVPALLSCVILMAASATAMLAPAGLIRTLTVPILTFLALVGFLLPSTRSSAFGRKTALWLLLLAAFLLVSELAILRPVPSARTHLVEARSVAEARFQEISALLGEALGGTLPPELDTESERFAWLEKRARGVSLLLVETADGSDLAWWGDPTPLDTSLLTGMGDGDLILLRRGVDLRLVGKRTGPTGRALFAEIPLSATGEDLLPDAGHLGLTRIEVRWQAPGEWSTPRHPPPEGESLTFTLPRQGPHLAEVLLVAAPGEEIQAVRCERARGRASLGFLGLALILMVLLRRAGETVPAGRFFLGHSLLLWIGRLSAAVATQALRPDHPLFDPLEYAGAAPLGLLGSPADLLLTGSALALQAALALEWTARILPESVGRRQALWLGVLTLLPAAALFTAALRSAGRLVVDARPDLLSFPLLEANAVRLALQAGLLAITLGGLLTMAIPLRALATWRGMDAGRSLAKPGPFTALVLLAAALPFPFLAAADRRLEEQQITRDFAVQVQDREDWWADAVHADLDRIGRLFHRRAPRQLSHLSALRLWRGSALAREGLASGILLLDANGEERGRFLHALPPTVGPVPAGVGAPELRLETVEVFTSTLELLVGETPLPGGGTALVLVERAPENIPFLTRSDPMARALLPGAGEGAAGTRRFLPALAVFSPSGALGYSSFPAPPPTPPPGIREITWRAAGVGGRTWRLLDLPDPRYGTVVLGIPRPGLLDRLAQLLRLSLLDLILAGLAGSLVALMVHPAAFRHGLVAFASSFRRTHERRLLAGILLAALLPLLLLGGFFRGYARSQAQAALDEEGLAAVRVARKVIEDFLALEGGATAETPGNATFHLTDTITYWLGSVIRRDLSLYWAGRLVSTSRRDLFQAGVLGERLPAPVARDLLAEGRPTVQRPLELAGQDLPVVYGSLDLPEGRGRGVAAIPLIVPQGGLQRRSAAVDEVIFLGMVTTLLLLGAIAVRTARRMSDPIRQLARATEALAGGDLHARVEGRAAEEIGALMEGFNRMAENLERQRADLEQRKHYIETILDNATTGVVSTDSLGKIRTLNPAARELLHLDRAREGDLLPVRLEQAPGLGALSRDLVESLRSEGGRVEREVDRPGRTPGEDRRLRAVILPLEDPASPASGRVLLVEDVTETARSERLAAWAEMARRIAHEIKNPLTPISLVVEHLRRLRQAGDPSLEKTLPRALDTIVEQVRALRAISAEFSAYSRLPEMTTEPTDLARFVATAVAPYAAAPPRDLEIRQSYQEGLPPVLVDGGVLKRALVNLLENALQALAGRRGTLEVLVDRDPEREGWVRVRVRDDGEGMDRDTLARLFDPYFSTRDAGTGLGLPIARRAVEQHRGVLEATSSPGQGTTMTLNLPPAPN